MASSVCQTITADPTVYTTVVTSVVTATITADPVTQATSLPVTTTACATGAGINGTDSDVCRTLTSFVATETVIPGSVSESLSTITSVSLSTASGEVSTSCQAAPTSSSSSSSSSSTTSTTTTTTSTTTTTPSPTSSSTTTEPEFSSTTSAESSSETSSSSSATPPVTTLDPSTITSFRTVVVTSTGSDGRPTTITSAGTLNSATGNGGGSSSNTGAIAGGVVGGVAALVLLALILWLLRRKGIFRRDDEQFNEDMWAPTHHGAGGIGGGPAGDDEHPGAVNLEPEPVMMAEKEGGGVGGQTYDPRASWYGSDGGRSIYPDRVGGPMGPAGGYQYEGEAAVGGAAMAMGFAGSNGANERRLSRQQSMRSGSGHGHEGGHSPNSYTHALPPIAAHSHRFSHEYYQPATELPYGAFPEEQGQREELVRRQSGSAEGRISSSDHSDSARTAATTGSSTGLSSMPSHRAIPQAFTPFANSTPQSSRPHLAVLTTSSGSGTDSSQSRFTQSSGSTAPSSVLPTPASDLETKEELHLENQLFKGVRPTLQRAESSSSFVVPSQFLGARIANA
ncbi:hypothetical protein BCR35DRAFT_300585 [Leucosporidium creatinivorum]|uniref:Mid2 domain-containing protein n=1 Tax=Leucosporidium creatinivorum TaxID=106004 RepID=A0A1Y2G372_9BASI|nr:hypothetical protein BCR35DRAFT_300585 [Leucosporidium creatinivorum]